MHGSRWFGIGCLVAVSLSCSFAWAEDPAEAEPSAKADVERAEEAYEEVEPEEDGADAQKREVALKHFRAGLAFMDDPEGEQFEQAYRQFKKAYDLSGSVNALQNLAVCAYKLERYGEAMSYYEAFLPKQPELSEEDRTRFEKDLLTMKQSVAYVVLDSARKPASVRNTRSATKGTVTNIYSLRDKPLKLGVHPGHHNFSLTDEDGNEDLWKVALEDGQTLSHRFEFKTPPPAESQSNVGVWVTGGVGAVAAVAGVALVIVGVGKTADGEERKAEADRLKAQGTGQPSGAKMQEIAGIMREADDLSDTGSSLTTAGAVALGVGGAAVGAAVVMALLSGADDEAQGGRRGPSFGRTWGMGMRLDTAQPGFTAWAAF